MDGEAGSSQNRRRRFFGSVIYNWLKTKYNNNKVLKAAQNNAAMLIASAAAVGTLATGVAVSNLGERIDSIETAVEQPLDTAKSLEDLAADLDAFSDDLMNLSSQVAATPTTADDTRISALSESVTEMTSDLAALADVVAAIDPAVATQASELALDARNIATEAMSATQAETSRLAQDMAALGAQVSTVADSLRASVATVSDVAGNALNVARQSAESVNELSNKIESLTSVVGDLVEHTHGGPSIVSSTVVPDTVPSTIDTPPLPPETISTTTTTTTTTTTLPPTIYSYDSRGETVTATAGFNEALADVALYIDNATPFEAFIVTITNTSGAPIDVTFKLVNDDTLDAFYSFATVQPGTAEYEFRYGLTLQSDAGEGHYGSWSPITPDLSVNLVASGGFATGVPLSADNSSLAIQSAIVTSFG